MLMASFDSIVETASVVMVIDCTWKANMASDMEE